MESGNIAGIWVAIIVLDVLVFGMACAGIARSKGHSSGGWFVIGALLGVIGLVLALIIQPVSYPPQPPGWYADPWQPTGWRWWDGYQWTWQTSPGGTN